MLCGFRAERVGKPKDWSRNVKPPTGLNEAVDELLGTKMKDALRVLTKGQRRQALTLVDELVMSTLASKVRVKIHRSPRCRDLTRAARPVS
jgi:polyribonucleotide nucleotidyltransferase